MTNNCIGTANHCEYVSRNFPNDCGYMSPVFVYEPINDGVRLDNDDTV